MTVIFKDDIKNILLETIPILVCEIDNGEILYVSRTLEVLFGYDLILNELVGMQVETLVPDKSQVKHERLRLNMVKNLTHPRQMSPQMDVEGKKKDGTLFPVKVVLYPVKLSGLICVIAQVLDRTPRSAP